MARGARLVMLPALWEGHFGHGGEAPGNLRKALKPFGGTEGLGKTRNAHLDHRKTVFGGGGEECGPSRE